MPEFNLNFFSSPEAEIADSSKTGFKVDFDASVRTSDRLNPLEASKGLNEQSRGSASCGRKTFCRKTVGSIVMADPLNILTSNFEGGATEFRGKVCASQTSRPEFESQHSVKFMLNGFSVNVFRRKVTP